jgi:hypothetical protein
MKQISTFSSENIPIAVSAVYYFVGDNGNILRPISTDVLGWDITNKTPISEFLKDNLKSEVGIGIGFPKIETSVNIAGYRKLYYYDEKENHAAWHYVKNGVTLPLHFTTLAAAKKLVKKVTPPKVVEQVKETIVPITFVKLIKK